MLHKVYSLNENFKNYFNNYDFHNLYKELLNFCTVDLSAFYFDIRKTLYIVTLKILKKDNLQ
jgi:isoleucyl-tRNA synthetase